MTAASDEEGARDALARLYERFADYIFRWHLKGAGCADDPRSLAEDLAQETWERVARAIKTYRPSGTFLAWLLTIARSVAADYWRGPGRRRNRERLEPHMLAVAGASLDPTPEVVAELHERAELVLTALQQLTPDQREAVWLRFYHGLPAAEAAAVMRKKEEAVRGLQHRGIRQLSTLLRSQGFPISGAVAERRSRTRTEVDAGEGHR